MKYSFQVNLGFTEKSISAFGGKGKRQLFYAPNLPALIKRITKFNHIKVEQLSFTFQPNKNFSGLCVGDQVIVPEPSKRDDFWKHGFTARIHCFKEDSDLVCVVDQEDNGWDVEYARLKPA